MMPDSDVIQILKTHGRGPALLWSLIAQMPGLALVSNARLADVMGVSERSIERWKPRLKEFADQQLANWTDRVGGSAATGVGGDQNLPFGTQDALTRASEGELRDLGEESGISPSSCSSLRSSQDTPPQQSTCADLTDSRRNATDPTIPELRRIGDLLERLVAEPPRPRRAKPKPPSADPQEILNFEDWWAEYPPERRGSKQLALKAYLKALRGGVAGDTLLQQVRTYGTWLRGGDQEPCGAAVWLNQRRWEIDYSVERPIGATKQRGAVAIPEGDDYLARERRKLEGRR